MATENQSSSRDAAAASADRIGKVFLVVGQDVRKCLVCEQLFTRRASAEHAKVACRLSPSE
jgi:hypothetical protein